MANISQQKRYIFIKDYQDKMGTINEGSQIDEFRGRYFFNGGMCDTYSNGLFNYIVSTPELKNKYLKEVSIIYNKI